MFHDHKVQVHIFLLDLGAEWGDTKQEEKLVDCINGRVADSVVGEKQSPSQFVLIIKI